MKYLIFQPTRIFKNSSGQKETKRKNPFAASSKKSEWLHLPSSPAATKATSDALDDLDNDDDDGCSVYPMPSTSQRKSSVALLTRIPLFRTSTKIFPPGWN